MSKSIVLVLIFVYILNNQFGLYYTDELTLCALKKTNSKCFCRLEVQENHPFPIHTADCTRINLEKFPKDTQIPNIEDLDVSFNLISVLDHNLNNFQNFNLKFLNLSFNKIEYLFSDFFVYTPNLSVLDLSRNEIVYLANSNVFRGLSNLTILDLSFNRISTMTEDIFKPLINLKELHLRYNFIGPLLANSEDFFKTSLGFSKTISTLRLDGLGITNLPYGYFDEAHNLKYLSLSDNPLTVIPSASYTVEVLDLSGTHITMISGKYLNYHSLKVLKLNRLRKLEEIEHYAFYNLQSLEELHLSDSRMLQALPDLAFGAIANDMEFSLKKIYLSRSGLKTLNVTYLSLFKKLELVDLQFNPLDCNCNILWLQDLHGPLIHEENIRCLTPRNLRNRRVMGITDEDIPECFAAENNVQTILITILGILVTLLTLLILYLLYLGPFHQTNRGIGPGSPYQGITVNIDPSKAEHLLK